MALEKAVNLPAQAYYPLRFCAVALVLGLCSRRLVSFRAARPLWSVLLGIAVFLIWIGPDTLFGYRGHWLFTNSMTGKAASSIGPELRKDWIFIIFRVLGTALLVPVIEELFWRGWLMRWLANKDFWRLPLGAWSSASFWLVAVMFASEHGPYWEVGLAAGALYGWWLIRTKSLADCIVAHAVTNALLAAYVLGWGQWQYWL